MFTHRRTDNVQFYLSPEVFEKILKKCFFSPPKSFFSCMHFMWLKEKVTVSLSFFFLVAVLYKYLFTSLTF